MFAFHDKVEIDLEPTDDKNIILIGARNGRGKTSFLRIIRILIHGLEDNGDFTKQDKNLTPKEYAIGKGKIWDGIFHKNPWIKKASIKGIFEFDNKEFIIHRKFEKKKNSFKETLSISFDSKKQNSTSAQKFINNILPNNFAQFFFFDGEKLEDLMDTQKLEIKDSLETLLDIKTYEKLITNIKYALREYTKETRNIPTSDEIEKLDNKRISLKTDIKIDNNHIESIEKDIKIFKNEIKEIDTKLIDLLADKKVDIKPLKKEKIEVENELIEIKEYIAKKIKGADFLVLMVESLSRNYLNKLEDDKTNYQLDEQLKDFSDKLRKIIRKIQDNLFDIDEPEYRLDNYQIEFYKDRLDDLRKDYYRDFSRKLQDKNFTQIIYYNEENKEQLKTIFEEKAIIYEKFSKLKSLELKLRKVKNKVENATESESENDDIIKIYKNKKNKLENQQSDNEQKIGELNKSIELKEKEKKNLDIEIKNLERELNLSKPILNSIDLSNKLLEFFQEFKSKLLNQKVRNLENEFNNYLLELSYDESWIKEVKINENFEILLLDYLEQEMSINSLSAGQKQILATALIQALGSVSEAKSFICIDTPLARIDLENREQIITKYYPKASKQVIILSTNSEIDPSKKEYKLMKDFISKEYTIVLDNYKSSFEDGYFNEINRG
jgi:DNA sulfur modification protein DndD